MFRKYNKKIITAILVVVVSVGLIGPGVLLIFGGLGLRAADRPPPETSAAQQKDRNGLSDLSAGADLSTSSPKIAN